MRKTIHFLAICFILAGTARAQGIQYGGMQQLSLTFGQSGATAGLAIVNGLRFKKFFVGLGADARIVRTYYDYYGYGYWNNNFRNTSAFYADGRYYINKQKNFFAKLDGGVNLINEKMRSSPTDNYSKRPGYYSAMGLGFKARLGKEVFYSFDVSYCMRQIRYDYSYETSIGWQTDHLDMRQYVILVSMGFEIF